MSLQNALRAVRLSDGEESALYPEHVKTGGIENPALPKPFLSFSKKEPFFIASDEPIPIRGQGQTCRLAGAEDLREIRKGRQFLRRGNRIPAQRSCRERPVQFSLLIRFRDFGNHLVGNHELEPGCPTEQQDVVRMTEVDKNARVGDDDRRVAGRSHRLSQGQQHSAGFIMNQTEALDNVLDLRRPYTEFAGDLN